MTVAQYLRSLRARGIELERDGESLRVDAPKGVMTPELADEIRKRKPEILAFLAQADEGRAEATEPLVRRSDRTRAPLSSAQERLFYLAEMDPGSCAYNVPIAFELRGRVDAALLERALGEVVKRHEVLHSALRLEGGQLSQVVDGDATLRLGILDLADRGEAAARAACDEKLREVAREPFDLSQAPLLRARLFRLADDLHVLLVLFHHAVVDGRSHDPFERDLIEIYRQLETTGAVSLPEPELQYGDYAAWEQESLAGGALAGSIAYWKQQLGGDLPVLELPTDHPRAPQLASEGATAEARYPAALGEALARLAREEAATPFMTSLAAFVCLLHRYTGQRELVVGTPVTNRWHPLIEDAIGLFVNMAGLRISIDPRKGYRELVRHIRDVCLAAYSHQRVPFERVVRELEVRRDPSRTPVFQCIFALEEESAERTPSAEDVAASWWVARRWPVHPGGARTDLSLWLRPGATGLTGMLEYSAALFRPRTAERLLRSLGVLLEAALRAPDAPIEALPVLDDEDLRRIEAWNDTARPYPRDESLVEIFRRCARAHADRPALEMGGASGDGPAPHLSYANLDRLSDAWAARLQHSGVVPGSFVALFMRRSPEFVVALLATLKAGAAYVPVDPEYPAERQRFLFEDCRPTVVMTQPALREALPALDAPVLELDLAGTTEPRTETSAPTEVRVDATAPAYVMYTSGSTGTPKGVVVPHRAIARLVLGSEFARLDSSRVLLQLAPISFDASTFEIWGALLHGAKCVLHPADGMPAPKELGAVLRRSGVTTLWLTASIFNLMIDEAPEELASVEEILTGGEALSPDHIRRALQLLPRTTLINGYGPTEGTTFSCCYRIPRDFDAAATSVPIGVPIANTRVYFVDARLQPVPIGACGELVVGGDGLAIGYWKRPELDRERFVPDPFGAPGGRLYRTGDFGRYAGDDGRIEYLGRRDRQVKLRGFRIELGEIEAALLDIDGVEQAAVLHEIDSTLGPRLVAYVAPGGEGNEPGRLRGLLKHRLPQPMIPALFEVLPRLPLSPNGKIDRARLPKPRGSDMAGASRAARTVVEERMLALWQQALGVPDLDMQDDFFNRGGHSLLAVRLLSRINREFGTELLLRALIDEPTIAHCARLVEQARAQSGASAAGAASSFKYVVPIRDDGAPPPLFIVHGAYGNVMNFRLMPHHLPHAVYGIQSKIAAGDLEPHRSVEEMAADYIAEVRRVQPHGPYVLGGFSGGGVVAYEMGRTLHEQGEAVEAILLLDTYPPVANAAFAQSPERLHKHLEGLRDGGFRYLRERAVDRAQRSWTRWATDLNLRFRGDLSLELRQEYAFRTFMEASYDPKPSSVPCFLFRALGEVARSGITNPTRGWESLARGTLQVVDIEGDHHSMFVEPNVATLCSEIVRILAELAPSAGTPS